MNLAFGGESHAADQSRFILLPVPYEKTTTFRKGTRAGPAALLAASEELEIFDEELRLAPLDLGVHVLPPVEEAGMPDRLAERLEAVVGTELDAGRVVGCLGGEHSISLGPIRAAAGRHDGLGVLQIDAHPDLRDEYDGTRYGHGCVMRRALDSPAVARLVQVGLRAVSDEDDAVLQGDERVRPFFAYELARRPAAQWIEEVLSALPEKVYLSFDLDGLDPAVVPGTGTPEPGGLGWWDTLALLRAVIERKEVVAFDVVELIPEPPSNVAAFAAARLVLKILAYLAAKRL